VTLIRALLKGFVTDARLRFFLGVGLGMVVLICGVFPWG
jgi:hypothetical protein